MTWNREESLRRIAEARAESATPDTEVADPAPAESVSTIGARMFGRSTDRVVPTEDATDLADIGARMFGRTVRRAPGRMFDQTND